MREAVDLLIIGAVSLCIVGGTYLGAVFIDANLYFIGRMYFPEQKASELIELSLPVYVAVPVEPQSVSTSTASEMQSKVPTSTTPPEPKKPVPVVPPKPALAPPPEEEVHDEPFTSAEIQALVSYHNAARGDEDVPALRWSEDLVLSAGVWAHELARRGCVLEHSGVRYGENIFYGMKYGSRQTPRLVSEVMDAFLAEKKFFDYKTNSCDTGKICGHYTQIMWADTTRVGCARSLCVSDMREEIWVCHYSPQGNIEGLKPY